MTRKAGTQRRLLYVLHMENQDGDIRHYAGTTTEERFEERMREHRRGVDTPRTKRAKAEGYSILGTTILAQSHPLMEKVLSYEYLARAECTMCRMFGYLARPGEPLPKRISTDKDFAVNFEKNT